MKARLATLLLVLAPLAARGAGFSKDDAGTGAAQFLKLGADARSSAMGQAGRALAEDATATYWNPAGLAALTHRHASLTHGAYYQSVFYDYIAYAQPIRAPVSGRRERELRADQQYGAFGASLLYLNAGQIQELDNTGQGTGESYTPQDVAFMAGWGMPITRALDVGVAGKYISSRIKGSASTGAFDVGARLRMRVVTVPWTVSFGLQNLGGRLKFIAEDDAVPVTLSIGNAIRITRDWTVACDIVAPKDNSPHPALGTEYRFVYDSDLSGVLRMGYNGRSIGQELEGFTGISAGGGLNIARFGVDYAWIPFGVLGDTHRITLNYRF